MVDDSYSFCLVSTVRSMSDTTVVQLNKAMAKLTEYIAISDDIDIDLCLDPTLRIASSGFLS